MPDIPNADDIAKLASLLAPGIIIMGVRARFRDSSPPSFTDKSINYALVSVAYSAAAYPVFHAKGWVELSGWLWQLLLSFLLPLAIGAIFVFFDKSERFYRFCDWLGLRPAHHVPTAWDYTFPRTTPTYILVHLNDGALVAGVWKEGSFASSTAGDRDLLIAQLWKINEDGTEWSEIDPPRSMLICGGSVRMVEFIKGTRNG